MWRFLNSLPRALRQYIHNPRPSAGICNVDEDVPEQGLHEPCEGSGYPVPQGQGSDFHADGDTLETKDGRSTPDSFTRVKTNQHEGTGSKEGCYSHGAFTGSGERRWWQSCQTDFWTLLQGSNKFLEVGAFTLGTSLAWGDESNRLRKQRLQLFYRVLFAVGCNDCSAARGIKDIAATTTQLKEANQSSSVHSAIKDADGAARDAAVKEPVPETLDSVMEEFETMCTKHRACHESVLGLEAFKAGDMKAAVEHLRSSCMMGNSSACFNLGLCYETGTGVIQDFDKAKSFYMKAAQAGHKQALYNLGLLYISGTVGRGSDNEGTEDRPSQDESGNTDTGLQLLEKAAKAGLTDAQIYLGIRHMEEDQDAKKAVTYFKAAADQNDSQGQYFLGICYEQGWGVEQNECRAAQLYSQAASAGHEDALYNLAVFNENGLGGLPEDIVTATELYTKASRLGNEQASLRLEELQAQKHSTTFQANMSTFQYLYQLYNNKQDTSSRDSTIPLHYSGPLSPSISSPNLTLDWNQDLSHSSGSLRLQTTEAHGSHKSVFDPGGPLSAHLFHIGGDNDADNTKEFHVRRETDQAKDKPQCFNNRAHPLKLSVGHLHRSNTSPNLAMLASNV